jgi:hypothetical protein
VPKSANKMLFHNLFLVPIIAIDLFPRIFQEKVNVSRVASVIDIVDEVKRAHDEEKR